ncbi:MAG: PD-(D/E)XK nuclease family protein [Candidatus Heimdallarchaeaceae archaeon]
MTSTLNNEELKSKILDLISTDKDFRNKLRDALVDSFVTRDETNAILKEIKQLRIDTNKSIDQFEKKMTEMREDFNIGMAQFVKILERFDLKLSALGRRWGLDAEASFRNAIKGLYEKKFGVKVERWSYIDNEGKIFRHPSVIEADVVITDGEHTLIEIKAHARRSDIATLLRIAELYEQETGVKPSLVIISPFIENNALELAKIKNIKVYSEKEL